MRLLYYFNESNVLKSDEFLNELMNIKKFG